MDIEDLGPYQVYSRREILLLLRSIMSSNQLVRLVFNNGTEAIVTTILEIDDTNNRVIVDCAQNHQQNQRIVDSDNISFETMLDRIRILFFATHIDSCTYDGQPALHFSLPSSLIRLQRREFYRVRTPRTPVYIPVETEDGTMEVRTYLQDLSAGGIWLLDEQAKLDNTIGRVYEDCRIILADKTLIVTSLQVRNSQDNTLPSGKIVRRLGCQFMGMPNKTLLSLQRFITKIEREQNAKSISME